MTNDIEMIAGERELLPRVQPLWIQLRHHHAEAAPIWRSQLLPPDFQSRQKHLLSNCAGGLRIFIATDQDKDVAYCICTISEDRDGEIDSLFVAHSHRRKGIGSELMTQGMNWLREQRVRAIFVDVMSGNTEPLRLYERFGFVTRTIRMKYVPPADAGV